jgi:lipoprotein-anchoring transpeptidase ErfK/SrfK
MGRATRTGWLIRGALFASVLSRVIAPPASAAPGLESPPEAQAQASARNDADGVALPTGARLQTLLSRSGFSPGLIDGKPGRKTRLAIEHLQRANGLESSGLVDSATAGLLDRAAPEPGTATWTRRYVVAEGDLEMITGPVPTDWNERARLDFSGYADAEDMHAERGWCSVELLRSLNPEVDFAAIEPGAEIVLPDTSTGLKPMPRLARLEVDLAEKLIVGFDDSDSVQVLVHCSIAREMEQAPVGELEVAVIAAEPEYTFNPASWPEVDNVFSKLRISPGPRNPVGSAWIGLSKPGYGIHGTVRPQDIGKTGSHGCFRTANWDASRLAKAVRVGTPVIVRHPAGE